MTATTAIARRELLAYLLSPVGYVVTALFLFFTGLVFFGAAPLLLGAGFSQGQPASLRLFFQVAVWVFFFLGPAISMRTISEEKRLGTLEMLVTAPLSETQIVLGKFFGAFGFLLVMLVPTLLFVIALEWYGKPDYGELACGYLGLVLVGSAYLASGLLASTLTQSQVLAYVLTVFFWLVLLVTTMVLPQLASVAEAIAADAGRGDRLDDFFGTLEPVLRFLAEGSPLARMRGFVIGLLDTFNIVYFVSWTAVFLVAAVQVLGIRRWS